MLSCPHCLTNATCAISRNCSNNNSESAWCPGQEEVPVGRQHQAPGRQPPPRGGAGGAGDAGLRGADGQLTFTLQ